MSFPLHSPIANLDETLAREHECELEYAMDLLSPYPEMAELTALIQEALTYQSENGKTHWQSVQAFELQNPDEWKRNVLHSDIAFYAKDLERRFEPVFRLMKIVQEENGEDALDALDIRLHAHMHSIAQGIHQVLNVGNKNRSLHQPNAETITLAEGASVVHTTPVAMVYEAGKYSLYSPEVPRLEGIALSTTMPSIDTFGNIVETDRQKIGEVIHAGPAFNHLYITESTEMVKQPAE